jgi:hypothetical protein
MPGTPGTPPTPPTGANGVGGAAIAAGKAAPTPGTPGAAGAPGTPPKAGKVGAGTRPTRFAAKKGPPMPVVADGGAPIPVRSHAGMPVVAPAKKLVTHGGGTCALQLTVITPRTAMITKLTNRTFKNLIFIPFTPFLQIL